MVTNKKAFMSFADNKEAESLEENLGLSEIDIAPLAGLLEGEGSFALDNRPSKRYEDSTSPPSPTLKISMTNKDVIEKVARMFNKESFQAKRKTTGNKTAYIVSSQARPTLLYLLPRLLPYFGERRTAQVKRCIDPLEAWKTWYIAGGRREASKKDYNKGIGKDKTEI